MYDSLSSHVAREMFGSDGEAEELDVIHAEEGGGFRLRAPSWLLPAAIGAGAGAGITALGFSIFKKRGRRKKAAASFGGVDPRVIDARRNDLRPGVSAFGSAASYDLLGDRVAGEIFGELDDEFGFDDLY